MELYAALKAPRDGNYHNADGRGPEANVNPARVVDHEARRRIGKPAGALRDPDQAGDGDQRADEGDGRFHFFSAGFFCIAVISSCALPSRILSATMSAFNVVTSFNV